jgi:hypothetical protein
MRCRVDPPELNYKEFPCMSSQVHRQITLVFDTMPQVNIRKPLILECRFTPVCLVYESIKCCAVWETSGSVQRRHALINIFQSRSSRQGLSGLFPSTIMFSCQFRAGTHYRENSKVKPPYPPSPSYHRSSWTRSQPLYRKDWQEPLSSCQPFSAVYRFSLSQLALPFVDGFSAMAPKHMVSTTPFCW